MRQPIIKATSESGAVANTTAIAVDASIVPSIRSLLLWFGLVVADNVLHTTHSRFLPQNVRRLQSSPGGDGFHCLLLMRFENVLDKYTFGWVL